MITQTYTPVDGFELVTLAEAKAHLRLDGFGDHEDVLIATYIEAAQGAAENYINRRIGNDTLVLGLRTYQNIVWFNEWRKTSVVSVEALLAGDTEYTIIPEQNYIFLRPQGSPPRMMFKTPFVTTDITDALRITINCEVPVTVRQAVLLILSDLYERREDRPQGTRLASQNLLQPYRQY